MIAKGKMAQAVDKFDADNCVEQESNQNPRTGGKKGQMAYLTGFFKTVKAVSGIKLHGQTTGDGVTMSEWIFDLATASSPVRWNGTVVSERFCTAP